MVEVRQSLQRSIAEHKYAAVRQHSDIGERVDKLTSLDWMDAW
jgi:hypothetical protein